MGDIFSCSGWDSPTRAGRALPGLVTTMLNKCTTWFTCSTEKVFLAHCAVSPLFSGAASAIHDYTDALAAGGFSALSRYTGVATAFREAFGTLLKTGPENISQVANTATAMSMLAWGYPFSRGDQVIR